MERKDGGWLRGKGGWPTNAELDVTSFIFR